MAYTSNDQLRYDKIKEIYNAKVAYNNATTDEERQKQNTIATNARKTLEAYGYKDIADQLSATGADATQARKILEQYAPPKTTATPSVKATTAPDSTTLTNKEVITTNNNETRNKVNQLWGTQTSDRNVMANKYDKLEETAYSNPFDSAESKAIMGKYDLAALYGRDNAVASGGASNGGNIDSYASANAMRQQASLINQGQMAVLDSHNNKINNVKGILESLGVYQQNQDKGMQNTIALQSNEAQRLFENEETAKNNEAARQEVYSNISGKVGDTVTKLLNSYTWNEDGTLKNPSQDFQATINTLEKALYSATTDAEKAKILEQLRIQEAARNQKIDEQGLNVAKTYKYQGNPQSQASYEFDKQADISEKTLTSNEKINAANIQAEQEANNQKNATDLLVAQIKAGNGEVEFDENGQPKVVVDDGDDGDDNGITIDFTDNFQTDSDGNKFAKKIPETPAQSSPEWRRADSVGMDKNGIKMVNEVLDYASQNSGALTMDEFMEFIVGASSRLNTDKAQLQKVLAYFDIASSYLDEYGVINAGKIGWGDGVKFESKN